MAEAIDTFKLGYANRSLGLCLPAKTRVAGAELRTRLQKIGIYRESGHERFNGSLVIPILDTTGNVVEGVTDELIEAIQAAGIRRVLIAFDRDEAGERGAAKLAERLMACGVDCFRVVFPKGMDANAYALKVKPAAKSLGLLIRKAEWMGKGAAPKREHVEPVIENPSLPEPVPSLAAAAVEVAKEETPALPAAAVPPEPTSDAAAQVGEREIVLTFGEGQDARRWRVRGLPKNLAVGVLKVNLMVSDDDGKFHVDTLGLYAARARAVFPATSGH